MNFVEDVDNADAEILWSFTGNSDLVIHIDANRIASISVPSENWNGTEAVTFRATDVGNLFDEDGVIFSVSTDNTAPVADAGPDQTITEGNTVTLDASGSNDPDGNPISYQWTQTGGVGVTLSSPTAVQPTFVTPSVDGNGEPCPFSLWLKIPVILQIWTVCASPSMTMALPDFQTAPSRSHQHQVPLWG